MSLIGLENFAAPFKNKVHMVSIFMIAALFGVFRLQGGGVSLHSEGYNTPRPSFSVEQFEHAPTDLAPSRRGTSNIDQILEEETDAKPAAPQKKGSKDNSGLADIERSLGLR